MSAQDPTQNPTQDPIGSAVPPERPKDPTHFGGEGLYETKESPAGETDAQAGEPGAQGSVWEFAKRNHVPALLAVGGIVWLIGALVRRSTERW
jgi:hypothetical protein